MRLGREGVQDSVAHRLLKWFCEQIDIHSSVQQGGEAEKWLYLGNTSVRRGKGNECIKIPFSYARAQDQTSSWLSPSPIRLVRLRLRRSRRPRLLYRCPRAYS